MLVAGDTFRAAAVEQLHIWGDRTQAPVMSRENGADEIIAAAREAGVGAMLTISDKQ